ncbi:MAG TPA: 3-oxoadipate enol-lactonase [Alphaproteobacteria bacterium]|nr:3-oxoadipate enol-lactonase [Alphaproteobacteria bacterium]
MPFVHVNRNELFFRVDGDPAAPALMLSNSLGTDHRMWDGQIEAFSQHFRVIRYDSRGHGQSESPPGPYTIEDLAQDALGLMDELHLGRAAFCGLSLGGMVGQWIAVHAPARLAHLVLANTAPRIGPPEAWDQRIAAVEKGGMKAVADAVVTRWFTKEFQRRNSLAATSLKQMLLAIDPAGYAATCAAIRDMDLSGVISDIATPTLVIAGRDDAVTTLEDAKALVDAIGGAWGKVLNAAHLSNVEDAAEFDDAVLKFLLTTEASHG